MILKSGEKSLPKKFAPDRWIQKMTPPPSKDSAERKPPEKRKETPMVSDWTREVTQKSGNAMLLCFFLIFEVLSLHRTHEVLTNGSP